jgi:hypothetical protein
VRLARYLAVAVGIAAAYLLVTGVMAAIIPNPIFERMTPATAPNLVFWLVPAVLFGAVGATYVVPLAPVTCDVSQRALGGGVLAFLAAGCPLCNKLVVLALGASGALTYFEPAQPLLGMASVALLGYALWLRLRPAYASTATRSRLTRNGSSSA